MANQNLGDAKKAKNDEFYTQYHDIQKEIGAYLDFNPDVFRGKTVLLPCDDPEWSNFTKYFAQRFQDLGLKKLISTSYAPNSKPSEIPYQPTLFELEDEKFDEVKTKSNGKIFTLTHDMTGDGAVNFEDLEWTYLEGDGDFRSEEIKKLRDESDIIITNPPFSLFREFLEWVLEGDKSFSIIGSMNAITYREVFPLIKANKIWLGVSTGAKTYLKPDGTEQKMGNTCWFVNLEHGRRHEPLALMTMADNLRFNSSMHQGYLTYENYDAIEVPRTDAIPSDYAGVMGVPISFLDKYNPEQFEIVGDSQTMAKELGFRPIGQEFVDDYYRQGNKGQINSAWNYLVLRLGEQTVIPYKRILIRHRKITK